jgi:hypothetical protein
VSVVAITLGVVATCMFGLSGAIASYVLSGATLLVVLTYSFRRKAGTVPGNSSRR